MSVELLPISNLKEGNARILPWIWENCIVHAFVI